MTTPTLTASWSGRAQERRLLSSLLRSDRACGAPLLLVGGSGKRSVALDVLVENRAHFAYVSGLHVTGGSMATAGGDRGVMRRVTAQLIDTRLGPALFRQLCVAPTREEDAEAAATAAHAAKTRAADAADDDDEAGMHAPVSAERERGGPGRKRRKLDAAMALAIDPSALVPLHPAAMVDDLTRRAADGKLVAVPAAAAAAAVDPSAAASATAAAEGASATAASAAAAASLAVSHHRSQLTELVRVLGELLAAHQKRHLPRHTAAAAGRGSADKSVPAFPAQPPPPPTFFIVLDHPARAAEAQPGLLQTLLRLSSHTGYPVTLVLLASGLGCSDGSAALLGLEPVLQEEFVRIPFRPYTVAQTAEILAKRLWQENRFVRGAFESGAAAAAAAAGAAHSVASSSATAAAPSASLVSHWYACWTHFVERLLDAFHAGLTASSLYEAEHVVRCVLPHWDRGMSRRFAARDASVATLLHSATPTRSGSSAMQGAVVHLTASLLEELRPRVRALMAAVFRHDLSALPADEPVTDEGINGASALSSPRAKPASASAAGGAAPIRGQFGLPLPSASSRGASLGQQLSRTSKLLLVAAFLGSYNPADKDTLRFSHARTQRSNRRGKSAHMDRIARGGGAGAAADRTGAVSGQQASLTQLQLGPNACTLERLLAIFHVLADDESAQDGPAADLDDAEGAGPIGSGGSNGVPGLSACYQQLNALIGAHLIEQIHAGGRRVATGAGSTDLLAAVKVRCLLTLEEMQQICDSIGTTKVNASGAPARMGDKFSLDAYLYDGAKRR